MRNLIFVNGEYYHVYNRGIEKRDVFLDDRDYFRFLISIRESNHLGVVDLSDIPDPVNQFREAEKRKAKPLVDLVCYCLMPNHFHLILRQVENRGISKFMQKLCTAYTMYFNKKYKRTGVLFQGPYKAKRIDGDQYLLQLSRYIHLNPLDLSDGEEQETEFIKNYKWSSLRFYLDEKKHSLIQLKKGIVLGLFSSISEFTNFTLNSNGVISEEFLTIKID